MISRCTLLYAIRRVIRDPLGLPNVSAKVVGLVITRVMPALLHWWRYCIIFGYSKGHTNFSPRDREIEATDSWIVNTNMLIYSKLQKIHLFITDKFMSRVFRALFVGVPGSFAA